MTDHETRIHQDGYAKGKLQGMADGILAGAVVGIIGGCAIALAIAAYLCK